MRLRAGWGGRSARDEDAGLELADVLEEAVDETQLVGFVEHYKWAFEFGLGRVLEVLNGG